MPSSHPSKKILLVCGSLNQTTQMHRIAEQLADFRCVFSPYYGNRDFDFLKSIGALENTIGGHKLGRRCLDYLRDHGLPCEPGGALGDFDLAITCSDLVWPANLDGKPVVLVQEGMTDPPSVMYPIVRRFPSLPRWLAGTSAFGTSNRYRRLCVASEGYRELFARRGCDPAKIVVTGIPNFDDCRRYLDNALPDRGYVLCCTSDVRETYWWEDRKAYLLRASALAGERGKPLVVKLHPNENIARATAEAARWVPNARVVATGSAEELVANCDTLVCNYSTLAYVGLALGKEVFSRFDRAELDRLMPLQHGRAAENVAAVVRGLAEAPS